MKKAAASISLVLCASAGAQSWITPHHKAALYAVQADKAARDAMWSSPRDLKVGVIDNGNPRDGLASYFCQVIADRGMRGQRVTVHIIDIAKVKARNEWVTLGRSHCD